MSSPDQPRRTAFILDRTALLPAEPAWRPSVDVYRRPDEWILKFDLAGVRREDLSITVDGPVLTVRGVRRDWILERGWHCHSMEISYSRFERSVHLPIDLERASITAEHHEGMLLVRVATKSEPR